jgi:hypothetical protein
MCGSNTCDMYMCRLRHINDPVLSSLKMEGIRLTFFIRNISFYAYAATSRMSFTSKPLARFSYVDVLTKRMES